MQLGVLGQKACLEVLFFFFWLCRVWEGDGWGLVNCPFFFNLCLLIVILSFINR